MKAFLIFILSLAVWWVTASIVWGGIQAVPYVLFLGSLVAVPTVAYTASAAAVATTCFPKQPLFFFLFFAVIGVLFPVVAFHGLLRSPESAVGFLFQFGIPTLAVMSVYAIAIVRRRRTPGSGDAENLSTQKSAGPP